MLYIIVRIIGIIKKLKVNFMNTSTENTENTTSQDQQTLLGIAVADQALMAAHIAMFAGKTGKPQETIDLLHEITDEISDRYGLSGLAKDTMKLRITKTISLAAAIIGAHGSKGDSGGTGAH